MLRLLSGSLLCFPLACPDDRKQLLNYPLDYLVFHQSRRQYQEQIFLVGKHVSRITLSRQVARILHQRSRRDYPLSCIVYRQEKKNLCHRTCPCREHHPPRLAVSTRFAGKHPFYSRERRPRLPQSGWLNSPRNLF